MPIGRCPISGSIYSAPLQYLRLPADKQSFQLVPTPRPPPLPFHPTSSTPSFPILLQSLRESQREWERIPKKNDPLTRVQVEQSPPLLSCVCSNIFIDLLWSKIVQTVVALLRHLLTDNVSHPSKSSERLVSQAEGLSVSKLNLSNSYLMVFNYSWLRRPSLPPQMGKVRRLRHQIPLKCNRSEKSFDWHSFRFDTIQREKSGPTRSNQRNDAFGNSEGRSWWRRRRGSARRFTPYFKERFRRRNKGGI